ncbi:MAG: ABC-2 family transporter protein [candidate division WS6 bacterium OLB20]|uniref:ABC-2 family transporter protein n=1 Tax=candidate division WS6 bacterium OLB20 TaxID=1617426 RepID=A0A136LZD1_9BACT|nr:MAG: ABC-2 family transporter protein [candidate division WS6 bacterium OLB20]
MKTVLAIAVYNYKSLWRNMKSAGIMFVLPVLFIGLFGLAFGGGEIEAFSIGMVRQEHGSYTAFKDTLTGLQQSEDNEKPLLAISEYDTADAAAQAVKSGTITLYLTVPEDFYPGGEGTLIVSGEQTNPFFSAVAGIIQNVSAGYLNKDISFISTVTLESASGDNPSAFDTLVPGLIVYSMLILMPGIAQDFTEITEKQYIFRYFTSRTRSWQILAGTGMYQFTLVFIQLIISYSTALAFGFQASGNLLNALAVAIPTGIFVVAVGLLIGALTKKIDAATNIGTMLSIVLGFFSGSFIAGIGRIWEFELFDRSVQFNDLLPTKWATVAMETVLRDSGSISDITGELTFISISAVVLLLAATLLYRQRQLKRLD